MRTKGSSWYMRLLCLTMALLLLGSFAASAGDGSEYVIKKGDTLWDISSEKLKSPLLWPKLWKANPYIRDPHWIYPNNKLVIPDDIAKSGTGEGGQGATESGRLRLDTSRKLDIPDVSGRALPKIPKRTIVAREALLKGGYVVKDRDTLGTITYSMPAGKTLIGLRDFVAVTTDKPALPDTKFYIISPLSDTAVKHPVTGELIGYIVNIKGVLEIVGPENGSTRARITESYSEIHTGDQLISYYPVAMPVEPLILRSPSMSATVVAVWNGLTSGGLGDVVYVDRGAAQGVEVGDNFAIFEQEGAKSKIGTIQVFSVSDTASSAVIREAITEVRIGDAAKN